MSALPRRRAYATTRGLAWPTFGAWAAGALAVVGGATVIALLRADAIRWMLGRDLLLAGAIPVLAAVGVALGLWAVARALLRRPRRGVGAATGGLALSTVALASALAVAAPPRPPAGSGPPVHDVATDWRDPLLPSPALLRLRGADAWPVEAAPLLPEGPTGGGFLGRTVAEINARFCPAAQPLVLPARPLDAYARLRAAAVREGLGVVGGEPAAGRLEAVALRGLLAAREDLIARVRPDGSGARIDLRSIARHGRGDGGSDCARVTRLRAALAQGG